MLGETEILRTQLRDGSDAQMPPVLKDRLLAIPNARRWWQVSVPIRWAAAAIILVLLFFGGQFGWTRYQAYKDRLELDQVASFVVRQHPTPPAPQVQSQEETVVLAALAKEGMTMPPIMITYRRGGSHIVGGGVTTFNGEKAYFTLWEWHGRRYTLYQFTPSTFHLRENFVEHETTVSAPKPAASATSPGNYTVWSWSEPDHHCGWTAVAAGADADNPFVWNN